MGDRCQKDEVKVVCVCMCLCLREAAEDDGLYMSDLCKHDSKAVKSIRIHPQYYSIGIDVGINSFENASRIIG